MDADSLFSLRRVFSLFRSARTSSKLVIRAAKLVAANGTDTTHRLTEDSMKLPKNDEFFDQFPQTGRFLFIRFVQRLRKSRDLIWEGAEIAFRLAKALLENRGASVRPIYLPSGPDGSKTGLDDFLAAGHTVADLVALATDDLRRVRGSVLRKHATWALLAQADTRRCRAHPAGELHRPHRLADCRR
jgi:hypothetical protein